MNNVPFVLTLAFEIPENVEIETGNKANDCITWGVSGSDDD